MKYLSLFSGIGGFEMAMSKDWECVGYSEIDKYALQIYQKHFPSHKNFGDITKIDIKKLPDFDLLVGGSPCQDLSIAKKNREGLKGSRSILFYKFVEILKIKKPKYFLLENVKSMSKESKQIINDKLGVESIMINASLVSAQHRKRLFWCNWKVEQPKDRGIYLKDIIHELRGEKFDLEKYILKETRINYIKSRPNNYQCKFNPAKTNTLRTNYGNASANETYIKVENNLIRIGHLNKGGQADRIYNINGKSVCLSANGGGRSAKMGLYSIKDCVRKLTPIECERLQCFPDNFSEGLSNTRRYQTLGNAVNVEVVRHIIKYLKKVIKGRGKINNK